MLDLKSMSLNDLERLRADLDTAIEEARRRKKDSALEAMKTAAKSFGFTMEELIGTAKVGPKSVSRANRRIKYRDPEQPENEWSGRGRRPEWLHEALEAGKKLEDFAV